MDVWKKNTCWNNIIRKIVLVFIMPLLGLGQPSYTVSVNNNPFPANLFVKTIGQGPNKPATILDPDGIILFSEEFGMKGWD